MKKKRTYILIGLTVIVLFFTIFSFSRFYAGIQEEESVIRRLSLQSAAKREAAMVDMKIVSYFDTLRVIAEFVNDDALLTEPNLAHLKAMQSTVEFQQLGYLTPEGMLYLADGDILDMREREYIRKFQMGQTSLTDTFTDEAGDKFAIIIPITLKNGDILGGVFGSFLPEQLRMEGGWWARGTTPNFYVIDESGHFILNSEMEQNPFADVENIAERLDADAEAGISPQLLLQRLQAAQDTAERITVGGAAYFAAFSPMQFSGWFSVVISPVSQMQHYSEELLGEHLLPLILQILVAIGLFCATLLFVMMRDVEQERRKEKTLRRGLITGTVAYLEADLDEDLVLHCSDSKILREFSNLPFSDYVKRIIERYVHPDYQENALLQLSAANVRLLFRRNISENTANFFVRLPEHGILWYECSTHAMQNEENGHLMVYYTLRNITEKASEERRLKEKAERDGLTGLYNRLTATEAINAFLQTDAQNSYAQHAFLILDLDNFKELNDTLGHKMGDVALQNIAGILTDYFHRGDIICRLGGDEFIIFLKNTPPAAAEEKVRTLLPRLELPYTDPDGNSVSITASIGISYYNAGDDFKALYQKADEALYWAKEEGKNTFRVNRT